MANRFLSLKLAQSFRRQLTRHLNTAAASSSISAVSPLNLTVTPTAAATKPDFHPDSVINLHDVKELYSSVPTTKLLRSAINLHAAAIEPMVDLGMWVMNSKLMDTFLLREALIACIRHTFYEHFCAGETPAEAALTAAKIWESGLRGMMVYALEHASDNDSCDRNLMGFLQTVESTKLLPQSSVSFIIIKITAICPMNLLRRVSDLLRWQYKNEGFQLPWKLKTLPIFSDSSAFYHTLTKPEPLTQQEEEDLFLAHERLEKICKSCSEANLPLAIDAEDSSVQAAIDYFTYSAAIKYNKDDHPIIYGTLQTYLKDAKERLYRATAAAGKLGIPVGYKLVRGAYMSSERALASSLGVESPIHNTIDQTHACFNDCASFMLEKAANGSGAVVFATHNIDSANKAAAKARELGIDKENGRIEFAQLYGMSDAMSYGLRNAGFQVSKYMPFGPVELVMPYLLRRAEENRGMLSTSTLDRELLRKELKRRLKSAIYLGD